jgi:aminocarboxymuconate-semialdehyde decarboxylase
MTQLPAYDRRRLLQVLTAAAALGAAPGAPAAQAPAPQGRRIWRIDGRRVKTVDIHTHAAPDMTDTLAGTPFETRAAYYRRQYGVPDAARLARMDRMGIDVQVLSVNPYWYDMDRDLAARFIEVHNARLAEMTAGRDGRFYAMASVSPQHPDLAAVQLETAVRRHGLRGVSLGCNILGEELASRRFDPLWAKCQELDQVVFIHPQESATATGVAKRVQGAGVLTNVIANPLETTIALSHLIFEGTLDRFPGLKICAAHGGGYLPSYVDRSDWGCTALPQNCRKEDPVLKKKPSEYMHQIYVDTLVFSPEATRHLAAVVGARRMMIGTDSPIPWFENPVETIMATPGLSAEDRRAMLGGTACQLLNIPV